MLYRYYRSTTGESIFHFYDNILLFVIVFRLKIRGATNDNKNLKANDSIQCCRGISFNEEIIALNFKTIRNISLLDSLPGNFAFYFSKGGYLKEQVFPLFLYEFSSQRLHQTRRP